MSTGVIGISDTNNKLRQEFFESLFRELTGYLCVAVKKAKGVNSNKLSQAFFLYPDEIDSALDHINRSYTSANVYFGAQLLTEPHRLKANIAACNLLWADLDQCSPRDVSPMPSISVVTSPGHYHGYWLLGDSVEPDIAEDYSKRIAYTYKKYGADTSGWDLTQLLRIPRTYNVNYGAGTFPVVDIDSHLSSYEVFDLSDFKHLSVVPGQEYMEIALPQSAYDYVAEEVLTEHRTKLDRQVLFLYTEEPSGTAEGWSGTLWKLECLLFEAGLQPEEVFAVCLTAKCNKFKRDGRDDSSLWRDVLKARGAVENRRSESIPATISIDPILTLEERKETIDDSFVARYAKWAVGRTDACVDFQEGGGLMILSSLLAARLELHTNFATIKPNLWVMLIGETTMSRKTTSMNMALELLSKIDKEARLATDGSIEGMMTAISFRPGKSGIFHRDEFSGFLAGIAKKDYLAGMIETLTALYDGTDQRRVLRRDIIDIHDPVFLIFAGGVPDRTLEHMTEETILSGFAPRFIYIFNTEHETRRPAGPLTAHYSQEREDFIDELTTIQQRYERTSTLTVGTSTTVTNPKWEVKLTEEAWDRYNKLENTLIDGAMKSARPNYYSPMMMRLAISTLKIAMLLAAARQDPKGRGFVGVELIDMLRAIRYTNKWKANTAIIVEEAGASVAEHKLQNIYKTIKEAGLVGIMRGDLMRRYHLDAKMTDLVLDTLDQRGMIRRVREGNKRERLFDYTSTVE